MSTEPKVPPHREWRKRIIRELREGRRLEQVAIRTELPFEVRSHWPGLDWVVWNETLQDFGDRIRQVNARLGPPKSIGAEHWNGAYADQAPDLVARWRVTDPKHGEVQVTVRALSPRECKIDPRSKFAPSEEPKLHPECAAALREMEDWT